MTRVPSTGTPAVRLTEMAGQHDQIYSAALRALEQLLESCQFAQGPETETFEREFAAFHEIAECVTVNSGTSALHLALLCLNIGPGDEVITVPMTFISTAWAISYVGASPVFVDIDPLRRTMDPSALTAAITDRTKAIIPVHLAGQPAHMSAINVVARRHGVHVVEDAAQAHGARYEGRRVGQFGDIGCFSFYPGKNLGACGEGGALVTRRDAIAERAKCLRNHGQARRYEHVEIGFNYRMDSLQAALLSLKLRHLDEWNARRKNHAREYSAALAPLGVRVPSEFPDSESVWHCYVIEVADRDLIRSRLLDHGIETGMHYPIPIHLQPAYRHLGYTEGAFPVSEGFARRCISLPISPDLTDEQRQHVIDAVKNAIE